jgi:hypothetical protein
MSTTDPLPVDDRPSLKTFQASVEEQHRLARIAATGDGGGGGAGSADELVEGVEGLSVEDAIPEDGGREIKVRPERFSRTEKRGKG